MTTEAARRYTCNSCGRVHVEWAARCAGCGEWGISPIADRGVGKALAASIPTDAPEPEASRISTDGELVQLALGTQPRLVAAVDAKITPISRRAERVMPVALSDVEEVRYHRTSTGLEPVDLVLGGGLVDATVLALGGEPGGGKSTLLMQMLDGMGARVLYATGEETIVQCAARANRIDTASPRIMIVHETDLNEVLAYARELDVEVIAIDSINTLSAPELASAAGSPGQVRECVNRLIDFAKDTSRNGGAGTSVIMVCHVTNDGTIAGPKTLKHLVDVVLELEIGVGNERILRCAGTKNRFGPTHLRGRLEMTATGLIPLKDEPEESELDR